MKDYLFQVQIPNGADVVELGRNERELDKNSASSASVARAIWSIPKSWRASARKTIIRSCSNRTTPTWCWSTPAALSALPRKNPSRPYSKFHRLKEDGKVKKLIVAGCLSQRYPDELARELPEVDFFIGTGEVPRIAEILREHERQLHPPAIRRYPELPLRSHHSAVAIDAVLHDLSQSLRRLRSQVRLLHYSSAPRPASQPFHRFGRSRSDDTESQDGVKEINLIAQDLTAYGRDRKDGTTLYGLLREMAQYSEARLDSPALCLSKFPRSNPCLK